MKVRSPLGWMILEYCSWFRCWVGDFGTRLGYAISDKRWLIKRWLRCVTTHRGAWTRRPVHHSWSYECARCGRRWTVHD